MPPTDALLQTLAANVRLLRGMTRTQLISLLSVAEKCAEPAHHYFFEEGDTGASFHIIIGGKVVVYQMRDGRRVDLAQLHSGDCFGEMSLVGQRTRSATVRALEDTLTLRFPRERVESLPSVAAVIYRNIATVLVHRLVQSNQKVGELLIRQEQAAPVAQDHLYGIRPPPKPFS